MLLHAGIADRRMWREQMPALAARHRVVALDLRGYGDSELPPAPFAHHDDVVGLLDALGLDRAALVGCSFGGKVAVDTALAHPERVSALALFGAPVSGNEWSEETEQLWETLVGEVDPEDFAAVRRRGGAVLGGRPGPPARGRRPGADPVRPGDGPAGARRRAGAERRRGRRARRRRRSTGWASCGCRCWSAPAPRTYRTSAGSPTGSPPRPPTRYGCLTSRTPRHLLPLERPGAGQRRPARLPALTPTPPR